MKQIFWADLEMTGLDPKSCVIIEFAGIITDLDFNSLDTYHAVVFQEPSGSILPLGGLDRGHKGFALGLLVEALTSGLCGFGRRDKPGRWGATVFLMMIDPEALGGRERFVEETSWIAKACLDGEPIDSDNPVRLPGQSALAKKRRYLKEGVELEPGILPALEKWSAVLGVAVPEPSTPEK